MKKPKTLFDQAIEIIDAGHSPCRFLLDNVNHYQHQFFSDATRPYINDNDGEEYNDLSPAGGFDLIIYTRLLLARELWNDGQEKYWKQGLFK